MAVSAGVALAGSVGWVVRDVPQPSSFSVGDVVACEVEEKCDRYQLLLMNVGNEASHGAITVTDKLPAGLKAKEEEKFIVSGEFNRESRSRWECEVVEAGGGLRCVAPENEETGEIESVGAGSFAPTIDVIVTAPTPGMLGVLRNEVTIEGGGGGTTTAIGENMVGGGVPGFAVSGLAFEPLVAGGGGSVVAGGHPWALTTSFGAPVIDSPPHGLEGGQLFAPVRNIKNVSVELPAGLVGDALATERCAESALRSHECPPGSQVGVIGLLDGVGSVHGGPFVFTGDESSFETASPVFNMVPEAGYPAEFGFTFAENVPVVLYADLVHTGTGYRVRVTSPGVPATEETEVSTLTIYGEPGQFNGDPSNETAFLDDPSDCSAEGEGFSRGAVGTAKGDASRIELESWGEPGHVVSAETAGYPSLNGCASLRFSPSLTVGPTVAGDEGVENGTSGQVGTEQADSPSAYTVDLTLPQSANTNEPAAAPKYTESATADLKTATVTLPEGVSVSPSSANGLVGCQATGPEGINIGSDDIGLGGQDLGDPEATELGAGHAGPGGDSSPYDDGFYHTAPGHCPQASSLGSVEIFTPLLPKLCGEAGQALCKPGESPAPLQGHIYLAQPKCGGEAQPACKESANPSEDSAENGELFSAYIEAKEANGPGSIVKLAGKVSANPQTGQLTGTFAENPQLPFDNLKLHFKGGPRAPLANPQSCGSFTTTSLLEAWSHKEAGGTEGTPNATPLSAPFSIVGCENKFAPSFTAGTTGRQAGAYSPFVLSFARNDGEQNLAGLNVTLPPGLLGKIAGVEQCPEAQANAGTCGPASQVGTVGVTAGPGLEPYSVTGGRVYLTGPYAGGPFGLSIVVPAKAGPINLGNEVVRAAIHINPQTGEVTVTNPIPQKKDGVPFRLRTANVEINRPGFTFNATNCSPSSVSGSIGGSGGASAAVSSPYQATGCQNLGFAPQFSASTQGQASKADGASLTVKVGYPQPYTSYSNIEKVDVSLPKALPSRLTTLQKACTEGQFAVNPAGCPSASAVGMATATTPLLNSVLTGPAYLVSRGGAAFPDLVVLLQGEGVEIELVGNTDIKNGITYSKFETVPDAPVSSFELNLPVGPYSILGTNLPEGANYSFCGQKLVMPTEITAQNGATIKQNTQIAVTGACAATSKPTVKIKQAKLKGNTVLVTVTTSQKGAVTLSGKGLKPVKKTLTAGTHQLKMALTKTGKTARKHHRKVKLSAGVKSSTGSASATKTLEL